MAILTITNTLVAGAKVKASDHNTNYSDISTWLNNLYNGTTTWTVTKATQMYFGAGTAALPGISVIGDTTTGLHQVSAGVLGVSSSGVKSAAFISAGTTNATTYSPQRLYSSSNFFGFDIQRTTGVTTSPVTIMAASNTGGGLFLVYGVETVGGSTEFLDIVAATPGGSRTTLGSSVIGSPDTRTYAWSSSNLQLTMGGNTYRIHCYSLAIGNL